MRLASRLCLCGLALLLPDVAFAGPPSLPADDAPAEPAPTPSGTPGTTTAEPGPATGTAEVSGETAAGVEATPPATDGEAAPLLEDRPDPNAPPLLAEDDEVAAGGDAKAKPNDPGMVRGRREPTMLNNQGSVGLFHTSLPDAGGKYTFRFRLYTDFFRKEGFIFEGPEGPDQHARVRGGVAISFSPFEWGELFFGVRSSANRNAREQEGRQDAEAVFALGDIDFGLKGAYRFKNGIGLGGQLGLGLLSGSSRLLTSNVNFWFDGLFAVDLRYLTKKQVPFRFTTNLGWMLDNSLRVADYAAVTDPTSREVLRFALGGNHNRLRMRYAVDFPVRLGKERQFGIDPFLEWGWDISTTEEPAFAQENASPSPLPRSSQWLTVGLRANVVSGLFLDAGVDVGLVSPSFEYGPPTPPWQVVLGLGWSFDPNPVVKEVPVEAETTTPPNAVGLEGRIVGQVLDPQGNPIADARIVFPGLAQNAILTDASGTFTSYRFPAGTVTVQVVMDGKVAQETNAQVEDGKDTSLTIQIEQMPAPPTGIVQGTFTDAAGKPVKVRMHVKGQGVDEGFDSTEGGLIALELYAGDYEGRLTAMGFSEKVIRFTVPESGEVSIRETLGADKPVATPNVSGNAKGIRLKQKIRYEGNEVSPKSHALLDELAAFLAGHPEFAEVEIGVHTDDRGAAQKRSDERAEAVRNYLVGKGVDGGRLVAKGYGASRPVAVNLTEQGRAKNNRTIVGVRKYNK